MCTNYRAPAKKPISGSLGHDDALVLVGAEYRFFFGNPHGERKKDREPNPKTGS